MASTVAARVHDTVGPLIPVETVPLQASSPSRRARPVLNILLVDLREGVDLWFYLFMLSWVILVRALTGDRTRVLSVWGDALTRWPPGQAARLSWELRHGGGWGKSASERQSRSREQLPRSSRTC